MGLELQHLPNGTYPVNVMVILEHQNITTNPVNSDMSVEHHDQPCQHHGES